MNDHHTMLKASIATIATAATLVGGVAPAMADEAAATNPDAIATNEMVNANANEAAQQTDTAKSAVEQAKENVTAAQQVVNQAQADTDAAKAAQQTAADALNAAQTKLDQASDTLAAANNDVANASANADKAAADVTSNQNTVDALTNDVNEAQQKLDSFDQAAADKAIEEANAALDDAKDALKTAQDTADASAKKAADAADAQTQAQTKADAAQERLDASNKAVTDIEANVPDSVKNLEAARKAAEQAAADVKKVQETADGKAAAADNAVAAKTAAEQARDAAAAAQATAQNDADAAKTAADDAQRQIKRGSLGFFESRGADKAVDVLTNPKTTMYIDAIKLGDENDATSLKNMAYALSWIQTANDYRAKHGLKPYQVSDTLMAMAQANADWSKDRVAHSNQFATSENLAWGGGNPVDRWYSEKEIWDAEVKKNPELATLSPSQVFMKYPDLFMQVGHYLNIIDPNDTVMGVATNTDPNGIWGIVDAMETQSWTSSTDQSVEDYKAAFDTYYNGLKNAPEAYKAALAKLNEAKANTRTASDAYDKAVAAATAAHDEAVKARDAYLEADKKAKDAQAAYEALKEIGRASCRERV